jgi:hypothetical protein
MKLIDTKGSHKRYIQEEVIWNNQYIKINNKPIEWMKWRSKGIERIKDIIKDDNTFLTQEEMKLKHNVSCNFLERASLISSIPKKWIKELRERKIADITYINMILNLKTLEFKSKDVYWIYIINRMKLPKHRAKWEIEFPALTSVDCNFWSKIYRNVFKYCRETKLQSFEYLVINRVIACRKKLYEWKIVDNIKCNYCEHEDNIIHYFLQCYMVNRLWFNLIKWWNNLDIIIIDHYSADLSECLLFGFPPECIEFQLLNYICLNVKYFIYKNKLNDMNKTISISMFLPILKYKLTLEITYWNRKGDNDKSNLIEYILENM